MRELRVDERLQLAAAPLGRATRTAGLAALAVLAFRAEAAQQVFPSGVDLVAVDVTAVDRQGRPIADLRKEEFTVSVGGRPRRVVAAELLRHAEAPPSVASPAGAAAPPAATPAEQDARSGRLIVLVADLGNMSLAGGQAVGQAAARFLALLTPRDRVALVSLPTGPKIDFTLDHARVAEALRGLRGAPPSRTAGFYDVSLAEAFARFSPMGDRQVWCAAYEREVRRQGVSGSGTTSCPDDPGLDAAARQVYDTARAAALTSEAALLGLLRGLAGVDGPKTLVLLSQGLVTGASGGDPGANRRLADVADLAAAARATVYTVQANRRFLEAMDVEERAMPQTIGLDEQLLADGLEAIAGYTGGPLLRSVTNAEVALARVAAETSATWLLSFEPEQDDRDGKPHDIRVRVKRDGVTVRARPRFVVGRADTRALTPEDRARRALEAPLPGGDVSLSVAAHVLTGAKEGEVRLLLAAEATLPPGDAPAAALGYGLTGEAGEHVAGAIEVGRLAPVRSAEGETLYGVVTLAAKPGSYGLKVAAASPSGRVGSVERTVEARLRTAGALRVSDVLLAEPGRRDSGVVLSVDGRLAGRTARAYLEVEAPPGVAAPSVQFELAAAGTDAAGSVTGAAVRPQATPGLFAAEATLDLGSLAPGRYELRAVLRLPDGTEAGRVVRPLELLPKP